MEEGIETSVVTEKRIAARILEKEVSDLFEKGGFVGGIEFLSEETPAHNLKHVKQVAGTSFEAFEVLSSNFPNSVIDNLDLIKNLVREKYRDGISEEDLLKIKWTDEDKKILIIAGLLHDIGVLRTSEDKEKDAREFYPLHVQRSEDKAALILKTLFPDTFTDEDIARVKKLISFTDHSNTKRLAAISFNRKDVQSLKDEIMGNLLRQTDEFVYTVDEDMMKTQSALFWEFKPPLPREQLAQVFATKRVEEMIGEAREGNWLKVAIGNEGVLQDYLTSDYFLIERVLKEHKGILGLLDKGYTAKEEVNPYVEKFLKNLRDKYELLAIWNDERKIEAHRHMEGTIDADDIIAMARELNENGFSVKVPDRYQIEKEMMRTPGEGEHPVISRLATRYLKDIVDQLKNVRGRQVFFEMLGEISAEKILMEKVQKGRLEIAPFAYVKTVDETKEFLGWFRSGMNKALGDGQGDKIELLCTLRWDKDELVKDSQQQTKAGELVADWNNLKDVIVGFSLAGPDDTKYPLEDYIDLIKNSPPAASWNLHIGETNDIALAQKNFESLLTFVENETTNRKIFLINPVALIADEMRAITARIQKRREVIILGLNPTGVSEKPKEVCRKLLEKELTVQLGSDDPSIFGYYASLSLPIVYWIAVRAFWEWRDIERSTDLLSQIHTFCGLREKVFDAEGNRQAGSFIEKMVQEAQARTKTAVSHFLPQTST